MDRKEFNSNGFNKKQAIMEDYSNIKYDESFDKELYEMAISCYFNSENFAILSEEQKKEVKSFFEELNKAMESQKVNGKFKLPEQFYLDVIKKALYVFHGIDKNNIKTVDFCKKIQHCKRELNYVIKNDNKFDEKVASLIWDIYQREDLAIGVHGTKLQEDFDISQENCDFFKHGIMVNQRYKNGDARRTVNFQDLPGKQWAFGYVSFLKLMNYEYSSMNRTYIKDEITANYSCIVVRPTNMKNTAYDPECPQEYSIVTPSTYIKTNDGHYLSGHLIKPEYILGVFKNNEQFVLNPKCDLDKLSELNEYIGQRNEEMAKKKAEEDRARVEKLGEETSNVPVTGKNKILALFKRIIGKNEKVKSEGVKDNPEVR